MLIAFVTVCESGSFSMAAEQLFLTQPAISKRVSSLEDKLDCKLFDRINRKVTLTEAGAALLPRAKNILRDLDDASQAIQDLSGEVAGRLKIATSHHIGLHRLPPVLKQFSKRYPHVTLDLHFLDSEKAYDDILNGNLEIAIITLAPESDPSIHAINVWHDPLGFLVTPEHELASYQKITLNTLADFPAILPGPMTYTGQIIQKIFSSNNLALNVSMSTNYLETLKMMTEIGLGWSVLPQTMHDGLVTLNIDNSELNKTALHRNLGYIYHRNRSLSNAAKAFIEMIKDTNKNLLI